MTSDSPRSADPLGSLLDDDASSPTSEGRRRRNRRRWRTVLIALGIVLALIIAGGVYLWNATSGQIETIELDLPDEGRPDAPETDDNGKAPINVLLMGTDSRVSESDSLLTELGSRADTIMVAHIPADRSSVQVMSIMRDSWVEVPGYGENKVNAALAYGGVSLAVQTVEQLIGQRIDHVAIIGFDGFKGLTEAVGGVTVQNEIAFEANGHSFAAGEITLSGEEALAYVRARYNFPDGDYQRVRNQQAFMKGVLQEVLARDTLSNPATVTQLLTTMTPHMATDAGLDTGRIIELAGDLQHVRSGNVDFFTIPTVGTGMIGDQSVVFVDWTRMEEVRQHFANDTLDEFEP
ncbi:transcriptional regulator [Pseudoclavibacter endophyticus]|uniref:LytR family transcriptional regulator n=1 Tax=Pseudoclavibacter endophyticus TaxID=1778590 RepID=A0A6H9WL98_9MICO|nr:LCP family protein [Pseudoclavibacter endophyticus]KAB1648292.1 LytR family transcriptional regulator [Pseudoclavibacter endophyticus]GGA71389.1 transcriptional regulator [Pseudoclavibacter endophyticus]